MSEIKRDYYESVLFVARDLGYNLLHFGAETSRCEDSCTRVLLAYGAIDPEIFATANYVAVSFRSPEGKDYHGQKRVRSRSDSLSRIDLLNSAAREICQNRTDPTEMLERIKAISDKPVPTLLNSCFLASFVGFAFTLLIGGSLKAALYAAVVDFIMRFCIEPLYRQNINRIFVNILGAFIITLLAWPLIALNYLGELHQIISGSCMYLFPGLSLMSSIRDLIASDYLAGLIKLVEVLLVATSIAIGSGLALALISMV